MNLFRKFSVELFPFFGHRHFTSPTIIGLRSGQYSKTVYQGYILPLLDYGSITTGSTSSTNTDRLLKLQKRAARIILRAEYTTPSATMFQQLEWQWIDTRLNYNKAILTNKALNRLKPEYISNLLKPTSQTHTLLKINSQWYIVYTKVKNKVI